MEDVAVSEATALRADKLIIISETPMMVDQDDEIREALVQASVSRTEKTICQRTPVSTSNTQSKLHVEAPRIHIVPYKIDGSALLELFT